MIRVCYRDLTKNDKTIMLNRDDVVFHYLCNVMRIKEGGELILFNGQEYWYGTYVLEKLDRKSLKIERININEVNPTQIATRVNLAFCVPKHNLENILRQGTELGVNAFIPLISERTVVRREFNLDRCERIITEACEQSGRLVLPQIDLPVSLECFLDTYAGRQIIFCDENLVGNKPHIPFTSGDVYILIGPEGGFSDLERSIILQKAIGISLGNTILKVDTACLCAVGVINFL